MRQVLGLFSGISGKVGNVVFVQRGKTTFVRSLPSKRKSAFTQEELVKQSKFGLASRIAGCICQVEEIKHFWKPDRSRNRTSYNQIFKTNHNQFDMENFSGFVFLSPDGRVFPESESSLKICESGIEISSKGLKGYKVNYKNKPKYIIATGIIILKKEVNRVKCKYDIMSFRSEKILFNSDSPIKIEIAIKGADLKRWSSYPLKKAFGTLITIDELGNPLSNSQILKSNP